MKARTRRWRRLLPGLALLALGATGGAAAATQDVVIGVLAPRGLEAALERWQPTADYLGERIPDRRFVIRPLDLEGLRWAAANQELDFVLTNPGNYVELEAKYGSTRLLTLRNRIDGTPYTVFGAVIFTRSDRDDITTLADLEDHSFAAVGRDAFGGFQIAWRELHHLGIDPFTDFSRLDFLGFPQDDIVYAVRDGRADAGTVRTHILERMAAEGLIDLGDFRILNPRISHGFPFAHSTQLYPEWPLAKAADTSDALAQQVAVALLTLPADAPAARLGHYAGWTVPLDYHLVHELFSELRIGPYDQRPTLADLLEAYAWWILGGGILMLMMGATTAYVLQLNQRLKSSKLELEQEVRERRRAEIGMRKLSGALEMSADLVMITDADGIIEYVNPAFEMATGYTSQEVIGATPAILRSGAHDARFYERVWRTIRSGNSFFDVFTNRRKDGSLYYEEKTITPLRGSHGRITNFVSTGKDITERIRAEERLRQHESQLAHVSRISTMGEMASSLAHELNQPLAAIVNYAHGCLRRMRGGNMDREELIAALEQITAQGERSGQIIHRLRNFMRMGELVRSPVDLNQVVQEACELADLEARRRRVTLELKLGEDLAPVTGDPIQLEQVVLNLVHNAVEAISSAETGGRIQVRTLQKDSGEPVIEVEDDGPGLSPEAIGHVFEAFYTTKSDGMGMGLSISRTIVEAHGGHIYVRMGSEGGACFGFTLPATREEEQAAHGS